MRNKLKFYQKGCVEVLQGHSSHCFPLHSHESFCLGAVLDGTALFTINGLSKLLTKGEVFLIPPDTGVIIKTESFYNYLTICIKHPLKEKLNDLTFSNFYVKLNQLDDILVPVNKFIENQKEDQLLNSCLNLLNEAIDFSSKKAQKSEQVIKICNYIKKSALEKLIIDDLAETFFISKYHLIRMFKKEMGVTPYQYHVQEKMRLIKQELIKKQSQVSIAIESGLSDQSHLCKLFKSQMGISPLDYKKNMRKI